MILKQIDFLSPEITLFYKGSLSHPSIISGILTIVTCVLIILSSICYVECILNRKNETPEISTYCRFTEDAGIFPINSSSFFHFISIVKDYHNPKCEGFDFTYFNLIGLETYIQDYENDNDLTKYNHWLYGICNNETDTQGISHLTNQAFFTYSACIKKYYSSSKKQYFDIGHPDFRWPQMSHGTFNPNKEIYSLILKKCDPDILKNVFGDEYQCQDDENFKDIVKNGGTIHFNFIDQYVDILKYEDPIKKYFYRIENTLDLDNYSINNINFNPAMIKTHNGFFIDNIQEELTYVYERNDVFIKNTNKNKNIFMGYTLWMNNRMNYYERMYRRVQDVLSEVGGVAQAITTIIIFINNFINKYIIILDTKSLLTKANISVQEICKNRCKILRSPTKNVKKENDELASIKQNCNIDKNNSLETKDNIIEKKNNNLNNNLSKRKDVDNSIYNNENNYKFEDTNIVTNRENSKNDNNNNCEKKKEKISFWNFLVYKISFGKKHHNIILYEKFREKVISVENLIINHLNIHNLLKANETELYCN